MRDADVGFIPVCDGADGCVSGVLTDRDLILRVVAPGRERSAQVRDAMTTEVVTCSPEESIGEAEKRMRSKHVSRLVCVDEQTRPIGVVSLADIAQIEQRERAASLLSEVSARREQTQQLSL
jgi:CBS domain-containing protein